MSRRISTRSPARPAASTTRDTRVGAADPLARITPFRVIRDLPPGNETVYEFWQLGRGPDGRIGNVKDTSVPRQVAMITLKPRTRTFLFGWYPWKDTPQVVELPIERLADAVNDLVAAGFGHSQAADGHTSEYRPLSFESFPLLPAAD